MQRYLIEDTTLTGIADAIREQTGGEDTIAVQDFADSIRGIGDSGNVEWPDDGKTRFLVETFEQLPDVVIMPSLSPGGTGTIDWGDGTIESMSNSSTYYKSVSKTHTYENTGEHLIIVDVTSGDINLPSKFSIGGNSGNYIYNPYVFKRVILGNAVIAVGSEAFKDCIMLKDVTCPDGVGLAQSAFENCYNLESIKFLGSAVFDYQNTSQGGTFENCVSLKAVIIPENVTEIDKYDFASCHSLKSITIPSNVEKIFLYAFYKCHSLEEVILPEGLNYIGKNSFDNCTSLKSITIPSSVTSIENNTFNACKTLMNVEIPSSVTSIGNNAFSYCESLMKVEISENVTSIGTYAFSYCQKLQEVYMNSQTPPTLSAANAFNQTNSNLVIYVPAASVDAYKTATNWSTYASKIKAMPE